MKKVLAILTCMFLLGCMSSPKYYEKKQSIFIAYPLDSSLTIDGYEPNVNKIKVESSPFSLKGTLSKEGFEDKRVEIKSHLTENQWAEISRMNGYKEDASASFFLLPMNTLGYTSLGFIDGAYAMAYTHPLMGIITIPVSTIAGFIWGVGTDIYNIVWGIPSVIIKNPWYEYTDGDFLTEILTPTQEFKTACYSKEDTFIGNNECLPCDIDDRVIALPEECGRCSGRYMDGRYCIKFCKKGEFNNNLGDCISCDSENSVESSVVSCNRCNNREMRDGFCMKECNGFRTKNNKCVSCDDVNDYQPYYDERTLNNDCYRCPNRQMFGAMCRLK